MRLLLLALGILSFPAFGAQGAFDTCGSTDDREFSSVSAVGRVRESTDAGIACSGALIGPSCMLSAGHCSDLLGVTEFNVPRSARDGSMIQSGARDRYRLLEIVDLEEVWYTEKDWVVYRLSPNALTGMRAGDTQGYLRVASQAPHQGDELELIGYGSAQGARNFAQKRGRGPLVEMAKGLLEVGLDTSGGDSGGPVLEARSGEIVGILTLGGCRRGGGTNGATALHFNSRLRRAIARCLAEDLR